MEVFSRRSHLRVIRLAGLVSLGALGLSVLAYGLVTQTGRQPRRPIRDTLVNMLPPVILETGYKNPTFNTANTASGTWARNLVHSKTYPMDTPFEWTQVMDPSREYDDDFIGASGSVVSPDVSSLDNPFSHPFCEVLNHLNDFEFFVAPDKAYRSLAAPPSSDAGKEYTQAVRVWNQREPSDPISTILGVEIDEGLVPAAFRAQDGDRLCLWGRLIVDTGHDDFHTEIHPPALMVTARPGRSKSGQTDCSVIGRPYLVGQTFTVDGYPLKKHLLNEVAKVQTFRSLRLEAHPKIMTKPFEGVHLMSFTVRPPTRRRLAIDQLMVSYQLKVRTGVAVQLTNAGDAVTVYVVMNDVNYKPATLPPRHDLNITATTLKKLNADAGDAYEAAIIVALLLPGAPWAALVDARGILTDRYDPPSPGSLPAARTASVSSLGGNTPGIVTDDSQPFPIVGQLHVFWSQPVNDPGRAGSAAGRARGR